MFYTFKQNNSGGFFEGFKVVIIEANSAEQANALATTNGVYFDGVAKDIDCDCCGDRWERCRDWEVENEPSIYGDTNLQRVANNNRYSDSIKVVYLNGKIIDYVSQN